MEKSEKVKAPPSTVNSKPGRRETIALLKEAEDEIGSLLSIAEEDSKETEETLQKVAIEPTKEQSRPSLRSPKSGIIDITPRSQSI